MAYRLDIKRILSMNFFHDLPQIMLGCALAAIATDLFLIPNGLAAGGVTGLATIIQAVGAARGVSPALDVNSGLILAHKAAVNPVFELPGPTAAGGQRAPGKNGFLRAAGEQVEAALLRLIGVWRLSIEGALQVIGQHRAGAHGIDAGFCVRKIEA